MSVWEIYFLTRLAAFYEQVQGPITALTIVAAICFAASFICKCCFHGNFNNDIARAKLLQPWFSRGAKISTCVLAVLLIIRVLCPSGKDIAIILGLAWATNSDQASKLPNKVVTVINGYLDNYLDDIGRDLEGKAIEKVDKAVENIVK